MGYASSRYDLRPRDLMRDLPKENKIQPIIPTPTIMGKGLEERITSKISQLSLEPKPRKPKNICFELK